MKKYCIFFVMICMVFLSACSFIADKTKQVYGEQNSLQDKGQEVKSDASIKTNPDKNADTEKGIEQTSAKPLELQGRYTTFYYQSEEGLLIPITRKISRVEGVAKAAVSALVDNPVIREDVGRVGLYPILPKGTQINGMTIKDGMAIIDFNDNISNYDSKKDENNIIKSIVYTLTEFDTIDRVQILRNSNEISSIDTENTIDMPIKRGGINSSANYKDMIQDNQEEVEIYFVGIANNKYKYYVPVTKRISKASSDFDRYTKTLNELIKGESGELNLKSFIPKNTALKGVQVEGQTVILNFNEEILNGNTSDANLITMVDQISLCFKQFGRVKKIKILINGKPMEFIGDSKGKDSLDVPTYVNIF